MNKPILNRILISLTIASLSVCFVMPGRLWALVLIAFFFIAAIVFRFNQAIHVSLFCFLLLLLPMTSSVIVSWPFNLLAPLTVYYLIVLIFSPLRRSYAWLGVGSFSKDVILLMLITIIVSTLALIAWVRFMQPDIGPYLDHMRNVPLGWMPLAGLGFAVLNASMEELTFRGIIMKGMDSAFHSPLISIISQAVSFGLLHYLAGFPYGIMGVVMTFIYALFLGVIRNKARGMMAPVVTHFFADLTIFFILVMLFL